MDAVGIAKIPPVPINNELSDGICPYWFVYPADLKFCPEAESNYMLIRYLLSSPFKSGRLLVIISYID